MTKIEEIRARHATLLKFGLSDKVLLEDIAYLLDLLDLLDAIPSLEDLDAAIEGLSDAEHTAEVDVRGDYGGPCEPERQRDADRFDAARAALQRLRDAMKENSDDQDR